MFYFIKTDQIMMEPNKNIKYLIHSFWGIPFLFLQALRWYMTGSHIYGFIHYFTWVQVIVFELTLFLLAIGIDYLLSIRHGYKLTIKHMNSEKKNI
jgi:hypothetical protein